MCACTCACVWCAKGPTDIAEASVALGGGEESRVRANEDSFDQLKQSDDIKHEVLPCPPLSSAVSPSRFPSPPLFAHPSRSYVRVYVNILSYTSPLRLLPPLLCAIGTAGDNVKDADHLDATDARRGNPSFPSRLHEGW